MSDSSGGGVTWLLVVVGWVATHYLSLKREKRKEVRSKLDEIRAELSALESEITVFHTNSTFSLEKARVIVLHMQRISSDVEREPKLKKDTSRFRFDLRKAATLVNFDKTAFTRLEHDSIVLDKVASAHDNLVNQLERNYILFYRDSFV